MMVNNFIDDEEYNKLVKLANSIGWSPTSLYAAYFGSPSNNNNLGNIVFLTLNKIITYTI